MEKTGNRECLAELLGIGETTIHRLVGKEVVVKAGRGKYDLVQSIRNYIEYKIRQVRDELGDEPTELREKKIKEQMEHERAKKEIAELKLAKMRGEVHSSRSVEMLLADMIMACKTKLRALPVKVAAEITPAMEMAGVSALILRYIDEALEELAEYDAEKFHDKDYVELDDYDEDD